MQSFFRNLLIGLAVSIDAPDILGETHELGQAGFHGTTIVSHRHGGEAVAVRSVSPSADRVTNHVHHPVLAFAETDERVERPRCCPHDVGASLVILRVFHGGPRCHDETAHQSFGDVVTRVVIEVGEILLKDVVHDVVNTRFHLVVGYSHRETRVKDGELRHQSVVKHMTYLKSVLGIGNHSAGIHLRARARHGQYAAYGQNLLASIGLFLLQPEFIPVVALVEDRCRHRLGIVAHAAAAQGKNEVDIVVTSNLNAFAQLLQRGVAHDARILHDGLARLIQDGHHLVVDAVAFHTATAVVQQHDRAKVTQFVFEIVQRLITKVQLGGIVIREITLHGLLSFIAQRYNKSASKREKCKIYQRNWSRLLISNKLTISMWYNFFYDKI